MLFNDKHSVLKGDMPWLRTAYSENQGKISEKNVFRMYIENVPPEGIRAPDSVPQYIRNWIKEYGLFTTANPYIYFMIDSAQPSFQETLIPMKNLNEGITSFVFGQEAPTLNVSGILLHTQYDNWSEGFLDLYTYVLRATKLAELSLINRHDMQIIIAYQGKLFYGSMMNLTKQTRSSNEQGTAFSFQYLVKRVAMVWDAARARGFTAEDKDIKKGDVPYYASTTSVPNITTTQRMESGNKAIVKGNEVLTKS